MSRTLHIVNGQVWPSPEADVLPGAGVRVQDGRIEAVGTLEGRADRVIDARGGLVMPGLIQAHVHLCQTLFRGVAEDLPLLPWLRDYIWPLEAAHDPPSIRASALLGVAEMLRSGTTAFLSMETVHHTDTVLQTVSETGIMGTVCHCLMDETGGYPPLAVSTQDSLQFCDKLREEWKEHELLRVGVAPRFALSCSADSLRTAAVYARAHGLMLHTHASEQEEEVDLVRRRTGLPNIEYLHDVGLSGPDVGLAHCVHTRPREREILAETHTRILHCPSANLKLGSGVAPVPEYLGLGLAVGIGADGTPCNNRLDAFLEMRLAGLIQKPRLGPRALPARDVARMATTLGAEILNQAGHMGRLSPGRRANLIIIDQDNVHVLPSEDPAANLLYAHAASDVRLTMVNGRVLYEDGQFLTIDEDRLRRDARRERTALLQRAGLG